MNASISSDDPSAFLRWSLRANATFSILSGSIFTLAGASIADFIGIAPAALVIGVGINLLGFAAALVWVASRPEPSAPLVRLIIGLDIGWVVGTAVLVFADAFSAAGVTTAILVANFVLVLAVLQAIGLRRVGQKQQTVPA